MRVFFAANPQDTRPKHGLSTDDEHSVLIARIRRYASVITWIGKSYQPIAAICLCTCDTSELDYSIQICQ
jgi:hypothetical protein